MKYKLLGVLAAAVMLAASVGAAAIGQRQAGQGRVHQHLTGRQPEAGCSCDGSELCTHLPLVIIDTGGEAIPGVPVYPEEEGREVFTLTAEGEAMLSAHISIQDDESRNHHPSDAPDLESDMLIRVRGNSSRYFEKPSYLIRLTDQDGDYADHEVMGMDAHYEWALYGPYLDKTLIRNYMWYNIAGEMMDYSPNVRFCEVILNGTYQGLYVMVETITNGEDCRVNVSEPVDNTTSTGFVLRLDRGSSTDLKNIENFTYYTYLFDRDFAHCINIVYPKSGALTQEMADAIEQEFSDFEKALYSFDYNTYTYGYQNWIDVNSFADYFILNEFTQNYDAGYLSTYLCKDIGERYQMIIWDFNSACNNYQNDISLEGFQMQNTPWQKMLTRDEDYDRRIIDRYRMWRESCLSEAYLLNYVEETIAFLGDAVERNFQVWGHTFEEYRPLEPDSRNPSGYGEAVEQLKDYIRRRGAWMDAYIEVVQQYGHPSAVKKYDH